MLSLEEINKFVKYWWFRYLMITEMYIVEKWEIVAIHVIFAVVFAIFWYFNYSMVLGLTASVFQNPYNIRDFLHSTLPQGSTT